MINGFVYSRADRTSICIVYTLVLSLYSISKIFHPNKSELHRINHHPILYKYLFILCIGVTKTILLWLLYTV